MQHLFSCTPDTATALGGALSLARIGRYLPAASGDEQRAIRLYAWNAKICASFYLPCQIAEVTIRNAISTALSAHYKTNEWYNKGGFLCQLTPPIHSRLNEVLTSKRNDHGSGLTHNHVISGLSFGFWTHMLTKNYEKAGVWPSHIAATFPKAPSGISRQKLYDRINEIRDFRNRIAHHNAVFDKSPRQKFESIIETIGWICTDTAWFARTTSTVVSAINARPRV